MDLRSITISHEELGELTPEQVLRSGSAMITFRARSAADRRYDVTIGRSTPRPARGRLAAFSSNGSEGGPFHHRAMTRSIIDAAVITRAAHLDEVGQGYRVRCRGLGEWMDPAIPMRRPALVTNAISGELLSSLDGDVWRQEAGQIVSSLLVMVLVTPTGEGAPHGGIKASTVLLGDDGQLHLVDPGVELSRAALGDGAGFDLHDRPGDQPWEDDETVTLTTYSAYPTFPPGTPGADMQAMGLMVYQGVTGRKPLGEDGPAPRSYNFGKGADGRGVPAPKIVVGEIATAHKVEPRVTRQMSRLVHGLLWAPCGHELSLGQGKGMREWAAMCQAAAESGR